MNLLTRHLVLILALVCINQLVYAQVSNGEGFEPLEGVPSPDEFVPPIQNKQSNNSQPTAQTLGFINSVCIPKIDSCLSPFDCIGFRGVVAENGGWG